ncbi:hypothetical protein CSB93_2233 [Pseudomonas paraeruginosa]|uniref:Uncharacterized protein n=1 Tax=Pseudomonas paraeruginosa TaxID=2994495 RepID=A0A2R3IMQ1_9PSED|nr:hypothetical protein CSB93_2233 [Pseudomonas paraeruginosa]AWE90740.1 hypothetical protein CSC28_1000 [Pseudomonas paraeruginosa]PTC38714.1 hypothetical protein CLJ1_0685 [Pseudomonas aeruginosa]
MAAHGAGRHCYGLREGWAVSCLGAVDRSASIRTARRAASNRAGRNATTD